MCQVKTHSRRANEVETKMSSQLKIQNDQAQRPGPRNEWIATPTRGPGSCSAWRPHRVHRYSFTGQVCCKHSSDFPSNCRAEYVRANSAIEPGGSSAMTPAMLLQK
jgi:hypothetical protein